MDLQLTPEQNMLRDSAARFMDDHYSLDARQKLLRSKLGHSTEHWQTMAELGWLGLTVPEAAGGIGATQVDNMVLCEQFGRGLLLEPYLATCVLGLGVLTQLAPKPELSALIADVIGGNVRLALACHEEAGGPNLTHVATRASAVTDGFRLSGRKTMVVSGDSAHHLIVVARTEGSIDTPQGITLFLLAADAAGVRITGFPTVDGLRAAQIELDDVHVPPAAALGELGGGYPLLAYAAMNGLLALGAEAVGAMEVLYKDTVEYIQTREQFDHPLSEFQVLRHRMVDMFIEYEQCKSMLYRATMEAEARGVAAMPTVHALKYMVGRAGVELGELAVQTHGGMGMTEELRIGHYFKRLLAIDALFGNSDYHLHLFAYRD